MLAGCTPLAAPAARDRIVSIDYCADQMLLGLVARDRIAAVSAEADDDPAFAAPMAVGLARVRADAERVLALRPTLVVRSYGGGPRFAAAMARAGVPVFTLPYAASLAEVDDVMAASGEALGAERAADARRARPSAALAAAKASSGGRGTALYVTPGDVTTGPGSLVAELIAAAGHASYEQRPGWHRLPVERIVAEPPALVVRGFFETRAHRQDRWSSSGHRTLRTALADVPTVSIPGSELACGNWRVGDAALRIAGARR